MSTSCLRPRTRRLLLLRKVHNERSLVLGSRWPYRRGVIFLLAVGVIALVALTYIVFGATRALLLYIDRPPPSEHTQETEERLLWLEGIAKGIDARFETLTQAVADGISHTKRAEKRVQKTVTSARRLIRESGLEHAAIDAEFEELHDGDEGGSAPEELPAVQEVLEFDGPSGIPGLSRSELATMRGA